MDAPSDLADDDDDAWHIWYYERIGYRYTPPPKVVAAANALLQMTTPTVMSCFAAGTPIRTLEGPRPIESLRTGDQVLSQDVATGALAFRPVLAVHHNAPDKTCASRSTAATRSWPAGSIASGSRAAAGPWPAT